MTDIDIKIEITLMLAHEGLSDLMITAFDGGVGGCWYWARAAGEGWLKVDPDKSWLQVAVVDREDPDEVWVVNHETLASGIERILTGVVKVGPATEVLIWQSVQGAGLGELDAEAADVIVQAGLFNEVVYG